MILVFDVGNTETTVGLFDGDELAAHWRLTTGVTRTPDEYAVLLHSLLHLSGVDRSRVRGGAVGSVVPPVTQPLSDGFRDLVGAPPLVVDGSSPLGITLDVDEPRTVGADRIINTLAASRMYGRDTIAVDLGTATTYDCITADGVFLGGVIQPGVLTSAETLFRRTSKLPATELVPPLRVIGRRTEECIRAGVLYGAAESIDGIVRRIKAEWPRPGVAPLVIATGGLAETLKAHCRELDRVEPFLTLHGLRIAHGILAPGSP
ncbi:MAG TPA: type III pantothenate kinase [Gemmatimonadaceae bacterium]|nr:type III pantothenate kinase [Gemmatimonadaceae bacterium]